MFAVGAILGGIFGALGGIALIIAGYMFLSSKMTAARFGLQCFFSD